ncbi:carbohydrate-binding module family 50 protein [Periconia macrospinosa]|uniref:Carbohydrate-binding module family 50 protein n=1 Tax=Periconia macrospinosa TaxID=97972 RepID=A0A2V1DP53_9PLEO|nr:carbohydrate-binding module family 50 protein [Periconia macrospinosa]
MPTRLFALGVVSALLTPLVFCAPTPGDIVCRYEATTPAQVNYYTCTELSLKYFITVDKFFELNPSVDKDCETIKPNAVYCVKGWKQPPLANDGLCGLPHNNASCAGLDKQCCNSETWTCGNEE